MEWYLKDSMFEEFDGDLAIALAYAWHKEFCSNKIKWASQKPQKGFRWESMGADFSDKEAYTRYREHSALEYFIMPESFSEKSHALYKSKVKPFVLSEPPRIDCYIFPKNLAWTFVLTHETGWLGPYFKVHKDYKALQHKNIEAVKAFELAKIYT